jgi:hypothetical protein
MGFFRHSSTTAPTDTIPASTTLSARPRLSRGASIATASVITCAGVFYVSAQAAPKTSSPLQSGKPASASSVQLSVNQGNDATELGADAAAQAETSVSATHSFSSNGGGANASVIVNGQAVAVPSSGNVSKTIVDDGGVTSLEITSNSEGSSSNSTFTSLNVNVNSSTNSFNDNSP